MRDRCCWAVDRGLETRAWRRGSGGVRNPPLGDESAHPVEKDINYALSLDSEDSTIT